MDTTNSSSTTAAANATNISTTNTTTASNTTTSNTIKDDRFTFSQLLDIAMNPDGLSTQQSTHNLHRYQSSIIAALDTYLKLPLGMY